MITLVATVAGVDAQSAVTIYTLRDATGEVKARDMNGGGGGAVVGSAVRVYGKVASFAAERGINMYGTCDPATPEEVEHHAAAVRLVELEHTRPRPAAAKMYMPSGSSAGAAGGATFGAAAGASAMATDQSGGLDARVRSFFEQHVHGPDGKAGASVDAVAAALAVDANKVQSVLERFEENGHLYTTTDDRTFRLTGAM